MKFEPYIVLHSRVNVTPGGDPAPPGLPGVPFGSWEVNGLLIPVDVRDTVASVRGSGSGAAWPMATVELNLAKARLHCWQWKGPVDTDDRIAIVTRADGDGARKILFSGWIVDARWRFDRSERAMFTAVGAPYRLARDKQYIVHGRVMANDSGELYGLYTGLECVFNANGRPNRSAERLEGHAGHSSYVFTYDGDPDGEYWTALEAAEYLMAWYNTGETWMTNYAFTQDDFVEAAGSSPIVADVNGKSLWDALATVLDVGGYDLCERLSIDAGLSIISQIDLVRRGTGITVVVDHQAHNVGDPMPALDLEKTNLFAANVAESVSSCVARPVVAGGRDLYEITVELQPAWDAGDLDTTAKPVMTRDIPMRKNSIYAKRYVVGGVDFARYASVGRLWDANTDGLFDALGLTVTDVAPLCDFPPGAFPQMPYEPVRMLTRIAASQFSAGSEMFVEYSMDSGATWQQYPGAFNTQKRLGVYLSQANLAEIGTTGSGVTASRKNFWRALLDGTLKVRMTCTIASPYRSVIEMEQREESPTYFETGAFFDKQTLGQVRVVSTGSRFDSASGLTANTSDGSDELESAADTLRKINDVRDVEASMVIERIDPVAFPLCGTVPVIEGINIDLQTGSMENPVIPRIVKRNYYLDPRQVQTEIVLDTDRQSAVL